MRRRRVLLVAALLSWSGAASAQDPLLPAEVAASAARHYPQVIEALAARQGASGALLAAEGAFDAVFSVEGQSRATGFWTGDVVAAKLSKPLRPLGAEVYGRYKLSDGTFPVYEDEFFTNEGGEFKIGVLFNLLRNKDVDARRFGVADAALALRQAEFDLLLTRIGVQRRALLAYYAWVEAGREVAVYRDLLALAQTRQGALEQEVARGARAAIFLTENRQNLTRRRVLVEAAERDLAIAANALSLYYRGAGGEPVVPEASALPDTLPPPPPLGRTGLPAILAARPDLAALRLGAERARARLGLAENQLQPSLTLGLEAGQDVGPVAEGGFSRDQGDVVLMLDFEMPLANRAARGRAARARADLRAAEAGQRLLRDRIGAEIADVVVTLEAAERLVDLAAQEAEQAEAMRVAEQRRFREGASDFFLVNLREQAVADARIRLALARLSLATARTDYDAAVLDGARLGLAPGP